VIFGLTVSGTNEFSAYSVFKTVFRGNELITGGAFGPENSLVTIALVVVLTICFYVLTVRRNALILPFWKTKVTGPSVIAVQSPPS